MMCATLALLMANPIPVRTQQAPGRPDVDVPQPPAPQRWNIRRETGQNVMPVFEGWEANQDGTFSLYFGYMNRNYEEVLDIPIGPNNRLDPDMDRGQPTHFVPRRMSNVFSVVVPKDFGKNKIEWTLSVRGLTEKIAGTLNPIYQIDVSRDTTGGNTPPVVKSDAEMKVTFPNPVTLNLAVTDDGLPSGGTLSVIWNKYRGPGKVTFGNTTFVGRPTGALGGSWGWHQPVNNGKATATATFSEPGVYVLHAAAADGRFGRSCCRTNALVTVNVTPPAATGGR
jgi:hypothetical protein